MRQVTVELANVLIEAAEIVDRNPDMTAQGALVEVKCPYSLYESADRAAYTVYGLPTLEARGQHAVIALLLLADVVANVKGK
jgi:hypothetical protein